ncbi:MAG: PKD domain-containing protein, partial [Aureispira sp.]
NIAMKLVIEGLKLQPCTPGMIDGRDAILQADQLLYNGAHQCLIWETFANRGFGFSADQGTANSRSDQTEAFDLPPICQTATQAPVAAFSPNASSSCITSIAFTDNSTDIPQAWYWTFGDGGTSTLQNPVHTYNNSGVFTVKLVVTNNIGQDSTTQTVTIALPSTPVADDVEICAGDTAYIPVVASGAARWRNAANNIIYSGDTLTVPNTGAISTYYVENVVASASLNVGPANSNIGTGGYHGSGYHGALNFTANRSLEIVSAWVDADGAGPRTFIVATGTNTTGGVPGANDIVDQVTINLVDGVQRINLNLNVPAAGNYNIGANNADLFRNQAGASYPYSAAGYMDITSSSSTSGPTNFYYYLYDLEVRDPACVSAQDTVEVRPVISDFTFNNTNGTLTFTDASVDATSWFWDFGDGDTATTQSPVHVYNSIGTYDVSLTINNGACSSTQTISITLISVDQLNQPQLSMALLPNPSQAQTTLTLGRALTEDVQVQLLDVTGKVCQQHTLPRGERNLQLDISNLPAAVYLVQLKGKNFNATQKLVVE